MGANSTVRAKLKYTPRLVWVLAMVGAILQALLLTVLGERVLQGSNDFVAFYGAGRLVGTGNLYDAAAMMAEQRRALGFSSDVWLFVRLPYLAVFFWPFAQLPYLAGWFAYWVSLVGGLVGFCRLWPRADWRVLGAMGLFFLPVGAGIWNGQDVVLLLLWMAIGLRLREEGKPLAAGLVWALLAAKPHLFLFLPVVLVARREWRVLAGGVMGGLVLIGVSFAVAGPGWVGQFVASAFNPVIQERAQMANLYLIFDAFVPNPVVLSVAAPVLAVMVWLVSRKWGMEEGLGVAVVSGILVAQHTYMADCALLLPLLYRLNDQATDKVTSQVAAFLLLPFGYFFLLQTEPLSWVVPALFVCLVVRLAFPRREVLEGYLAAG